MMTTENATLRAELLVSRWHRENRHFLGQGAGVDWQARAALIRDVASAIAEAAADIGDRDAEADDRQIRRRRNRGA